jgi:hypothetical protein
MLRRTSSTPGKAARARAGLLCLAAAAFAGVLALAAQASGALVPSVTVGVSASPSLEVTAGSTHIELAPKLPPSLPAPPPPPAIAPAPAPTPPPPGGTSVTTRAATSPRSVAVTAPLPAAPSTGAAGTARAVAPALPATSANAAPPRASAAARRAATRRDAPLPSSRIASEYSKGVPRRASSSVAGARRTGGPPSFGQPARAMSSPRTGLTLDPSPPGGRGSLLGLRVPPEIKQGGLLVTLTLLGGALLVALLFADDAGLGPRHRAWRARWSYRLTRR